MRLGTSHIHACNIDASMSYVVKENSCICKEGASVSSGEATRDRERNCGKVKHKDRYRCSTSAGLLSTMTSRSLLIATRMASSVMMAGQKNNGSDKSRVR